MSNHGFDLIETQAIESLGVTYSQFRHARTGARHFHLANADHHNAFMVAFPTLPQDSSGVAHILEHTTLCGSEHFPVRDPFFMMLRRSLNTYMNAFTSGDSTAYPFATQNHKDFENLLAVYLDAVFFPRLHPLDFAQEGWRVEARGDGDALKLELHGVVYNEMKGAMSSPLAQLWQHVHGALFPDAVYHHNSGGDPLVIPDLSHAQLLEFHARHYHPANAVLMTYGSIPADAHHAHFAAWALDRFERGAEVLVSPLQAAFAAPHEVEVTYHVDDVGDHQTHIVWAWLFGTSTDADDFIALHLLSSLLLEHGASPLRHYLEASELAQAPSELCGVDDSTRQLVFLCGVEGSEVAHVQALERGILDVMERLAADGLAAGALEAAVDRLELAQRDIGGGSFPFGLQLMGRVLPAAMYRADALQLLDLAPAIEHLRARLAEPDFLRRLVRRVLLDNPHRVRVVMRPDPEQAARDAAREANRLQALRASLDEQALETLKASSAALRERQQRVDDDSILPCVTLADVPPAAPLQQPHSVHVGGVAVDEYECATNGVFRARLAYRLPLLSADELRVLPLWCEYVTELGCANEDYLTVQARRARTGSFAVDALTRPVLGGGDAMHAWLMVSGKGLARKRDAVLSTLHEIVDGVRFDELTRLQELLQQSRAEAEQSVTDRGHQLAVLSAARSLGASAALDELWDGPSAIHLLREFADDTARTTQLESLFALFSSIRDKISGAPRRLALIGEASAIAGASALAATFKRDEAADFVPFAALAVPTVDSNGWITSSQVNFCAKAYAACAADSADAPVLAVLGRYLQDGFLHREIREQGGAYGSGAAYDADSETFRFFSYRDPRLAATLADFDRALAWYIDDNDAQRLEESILGTIRALDQPRAPAGEAERAFVSALCGRDDAYRRRFRERVLAVSHADLVAVGQRYLVPAQGKLGVIAGPAAESELNATGCRIGRL